MPRENNGRERDPGALTVDGLGQEILVASEVDAAQDSGPVEQFGILEARGAIILGGQNTKELALGCFHGPQAGQRLERSQLYPKLPTRIKLC